MIEYTALRKKPRDLLALTGLSRREFDELLEAFEESLQLPSTRPKKRQRAVGGGRKAALPTAADKLLFILVYVKTYPLQTVQAQLFGMSQPSANRYIRTLLPVLAQALDRLGVMPEREGSALARREHRQGEPRDLILDGLERRRQRPKEPKIQAVHYSGKKKAHTDKNVVVIDSRSKRVSFLSPTCPGSVHDKKVAEQARIRYPRKTILRSDLGLLGYCSNAGVHLQPKKSPRARS